MSSRMDAEFDAVAAWTCEAVQLLGPDHAIPAGCRGSGSPAALAWLAEALDLRPGLRTADVGAGVGGPAAWFTARYGVRPVCAEPMPGAVRACRELFGLPAVVATSQRLPWASGTLDVAWSLGVMATTSDKPGMLRELRRVLAPGGSLGLLVYAADAPPAGAPQGNEFPVAADLPGLLERAGFALEDSTTDGLAAPPAAWQRRADRVEEVVEDRHGSDPRWQQADEQSAAMARLLQDGAVWVELIHAVAR